MTTTHEDMTKTHEDLTAFLNGRTKPGKENPFWRWNEESGITRPSGSPLVIQDEDLPLVKQVQRYFRNMYDCERSEAQVLLIAYEDLPNFQEHFCFPTLGIYAFQGSPVSIQVPPQRNTPTNSMVSERFFQKLRTLEITPVARIHSHHVLDAYQSSTDYATLNSGTLEMVFGHIERDYPDMVGWLDAPGTDTKANVYALLSERPDLLLAKRTDFDGKTMQEKERNEELEKERKETNGEF